MTQFSEPEQSPGFMLWRATNAWQRSIRAALAPHGLTHVQFVLLATLASLQPSPVTQRQLADAATTDVMMTSQVLRALEAKGLIERHPHPNDKRAMLLTPTMQGASIINNANAAVENADTKFFSALGAQALDRFITSLATLSGNTE